jgi:subtilisin family serine protease
MPPISRPLLILMGLTVMLMAVWVVALRPKPVDVKDTPLAPTTQISKAKGAAAASAAANAKVQAATGGTATPQAAAPKAAAPKAAAPKAAAPKAAAPKAAPAKTSKVSLAKVRDAALVRDLKRGKVAVLLFWNPEAADDIAARGALRDLDLRDGKVVVRVISIDDVAQYESITSGVKIAGSPTTVIIGKNGHTRVIMGLTEPREVAQAVSDAVAGH